MAAPTRLKKPERLNPDLVVMDLSMPRMHGLDAITASGERRAGLSAVIEKSEGLEPLLQEVQHRLQPSQ